MTSWIFLFIQSIISRLGKMFGGKETPGEWKSSLSRRMSVKSSSVINLINDKDWKMTYFVFSLGLHIILAGKHKEKVCMCRQNSDAKGKFKEKLFQTLVFILFLILLLVFNRRCKFLFNNKTNYGRLNFPLKLTTGGTCFFIFNIRSVFKDNFQSESNWPAFRETFHSIDYAA